MPAIATNPNDCGVCPSECMCEVCEMTGLGVDVSGLVSSSCVLDYGGAKETWERLESALNGGYVLTGHISDNWYKYLGTANDHDDPGILIGTYRREDVPPGDWEEVEWYAFYVDTSIGCESCTLDGVPGTKWDARAALVFIDQCFYRDSADVPDWIPIEFSCPFSDTIMIWDDIIFYPMVPSVCTVPPGCNGEVQLDNPGNIIFDDPAPYPSSCSVTTGAGTGHAILTPIGTTVPCT